MTDQTDLESTIKEDVERGYIATFSAPPFSISGNGAKPVPTEPIQAHEDTGAAYMDKARKIHEWRRDC
jgi:hypothetical protein